MNALVRWLLVAAVSVLLVFGDAAAVVRMPTLSTDSRYTVIAAQTRFAPVGSFVLGLTVPTDGTVPEYCTGTLIGPYTVLTAAHCVTKAASSASSCSFVRRFSHSQLETMSFVFGPSVMTPTKRLRVWDYWVMPDYDACSHHDDIALLQVYDESSPTLAVTSIAPATLYTVGKETDGLNFPVFVGYGRTGVATPTTSVCPTLTSDGVKRVYLEGVFSIGGTAVGPYPADRIDTDFAGLAYLASISYPSNFLEGEPAAGDSGGPWFYIDPIAAPGVWEVAAIESYGSTCSSFPFSGKTDARSASDHLTRISPLAPAINAAVTSLGTPTGTWPTIASRTAAAEPSTVTIVLGDTPVTFSVPFGISDCSASDSTFSLDVSASSPDVEIEVAMGDLVVGSFTGLDLGPSTPTLTFKHSSLSACAVDGSGFILKDLSSTLTLTITGPSGASLAISNILLPGLPNSNFQFGTAGMDIESASSVVVAPTGGSTVAVPNVVGDSQAEASSAIASVGLVVGAVDTANSDTVPVGDVISESPAGGKGVAAGSAVDLVISSGPALVAVPDVTGQSQAAATAAITGAGLTVGGVTHQPSVTVPAGSVISESPTAGTSVALGSTVSLVISSGAVPGDLNGDGSVGCDDLNVVKAAFGKSVGQAGYDPRADINHDGVVNILDLSAEARLMPAGTVCH